MFWPDYWFFYGPVACNLGTNCWPYELLAFEKHLGRTGEKHIGRTGAGRQDKQDRLITFWCKRTLDSQSQSYWKFKAFIADTVLCFKCWTLYLSAYFGGLGQDACEFLQKPEMNMLAYPSNKEGITLQRAANLGWMAIVNKNKKTKGITLCTVRSLYPINGYEIWKTQLRTSQQLKYMYGVLFMRRRSTPLV